MKRRYPIFPIFTKEFILVTDANDIAVSAILHKRVSWELAPSRTIVGS